MLGGARPSGGRVGRCDPIPGALPCVTSRGSRAARASRPWCPASRSMPARPARAGVTREEVERAIRDGVRFLKGQQRADGSWPDVEGEARTGTTSLVTLALLTAGEKPDSPTIRKALDYLRKLRARGPPQHLRHRPADHGLRRRRARARPVCGSPPTSSGWSAPRSSPATRSYWPGSWTYSDSKRAKPGDNSNTQYALLGLHAASEAGVPVKPEVWALARAYWEQMPEARRELGLHPRFTRIDREHDLRRGLQPDHHRAAAVPGAGISSRARRSRTAARAGSTATCSAGIDWLASHFQVGQNFGNGQQWKYLLPLWPGAGRPARRASGFSASTTGIAWAPRSWSTTGQARRVLAGRPDRRATRSWRRASRCCSWPRAGRRS